MKPVSVILNTFKGATRGYLGEAIESVLGQSLQDLELIIVDDGSTDSTFEICNRYFSDQRVKYIFQENKGPSAARNTGIKQAKYDYISFLDDDDLYEPNKLEKQAKYLNSIQDPKAGMCYTAVNYIDSVGNILGDFYCPSSGDIYEKLFWGNITSTPATMIKKEVFQKVGLFKEHLYNCEDYEMWIRIAKHYHVYSYGERLVKVRQHQNNISLNYEKMQHYRANILFMALEEAPREITLKKDFYYHRFHEHCIAQHLGVDNFREFQKQYLLYSMYGPVKLSWKLKYYLSRFPVLYKLARCIKRQMF